MPARDPRIDAYIARSAPFAQPVLARIRAIVHEACPDVEETIKWGMPHFMYHGMLCRMAAFKAHCALGFWRADRVMAEAGERKDGALGEFGRLASVSDLPSAAALKRYVKAAMRLNDGKGKAAPPAPAGRPARKPLRVPADLAAALKANRAAAAHFAKFPPSQRREYIEWIAGAKRPETRARRLATAIAWIAEGKPRNWRYM
ncbi:MAG TPA: YdeI/OmpD-associated family protein [Gemmatimonadaceae bacterium]|jgi:uncharacterized protein YdeI (YjbR/CyaY-like superfamily)|nr:YdeI/OmpD-associated family protein [Gemmatimonadaceae bacterium]